MGGRTERSVTLGCREGLYKKIQLRFETNFYKKIITRCHD